MKEKRAFTLLELMVAVAVMSILVVMLFGMVDAAAKLWRDNENRVDAYREARAALAVISSDLRSMIASTNRNYFVTNASPAAIGNVPADIVPNGALFFLTALPSSAQPNGNKSDICAVGYYRRWTKQNQNFGTASDSAGSTTNGYHLFRSLYGSDLTYSNLIVTNSTPLKDLPQPTAAGAPKPEILARNIVALEFIYYQTNGSAAFDIWTPAAVYMPNMVEVRLTAISDELARKLNGIQARWNTNDSVVAKDMRTFVARVQLPTVSTN